MRAHLRDITQRIDDLRGEINALRALLGVVSHPGWDAVHEAFAAQAESARRQAFLLPQSAYENATLMASMLGELKGKALAYDAVASSKDRIEGSISTKEKQIERLQTQAKELAKGAKL